MWKRLKPIFRGIEAIYKIKLLHAILICGLVSIVILGIMSKAFSDLDHYKKVQPTVTSLDSYRFFLKNRVAMERNRLTAGKPKADSALKTFHISVNSRDLQALDADLPRSGKAKYVTAFMGVSDAARIKRVKLRYRGDNLYHWLYAQKSLRIKLRKKDTYNMEKRFNLVNPPHHYTLPVESINYKISRDLGLIAPDYYPVRVFMNGEYMGVYSYFSQVDESLLRKHRRMPGSLYAGDGADKDPDGISLLWRDEKYWKKVASRNAAQKNNREDIEELIRAINSFDDIQFYAFVNRFLDKEKFYDFFAVDVLFGSGHHDYHHNHKLYFDPYKGKFEPIQWDMAYWTPRQIKDVSYNPLLHRIKMNPVLEAERDGVTYALMKARPVEGILVDLDAAEALMRDDLKADYLRDTAVMAAYPLTWWASVPFTVADFGDQIAELKQVVTKRREALQQFFEDAVVSATVGRRGPDLHQLILRADGNSGVELDLPAWVSGQPPGGDRGGVRIYQDRNFNGVLDAPDLSVATDRQRLYPGRKVIEVETRLPVLMGKIEAVHAPLYYSYLIEGPWKPSQKEMSAQNMVTGQAVAVSWGPLQIVPEAESVHPWRLPRSERAARVLSGELHVKTDWVFEEQTEVKILPGTTFVLYPGASLFFYGRVLADGEADGPIRFVARDKDRPWGGVVVQGQAASGSRFRFCMFSDGSITERNLIHYTGQFNIHDVEDFEVADCTFRANHVGDDNVHIAYADGALQDCVFYGSRSDALDIDIGAVSVTRSLFLDSGNDALDFMTSEAMVDSCVFVNAGDKGISTGEWSTGTYTDNLFYGCRIGVEVKDKSRVRLNRALIADSGQLAINLYNKNLRYDQGGRLEGEEIYVVGEKRGVAADARSVILSGDITDAYPPLNGFEFARQMVGGLQGRQGLEGGIRALLDRYE